MFSENEIVKLVLDYIKDKVEKGAIAKVVNGEIRFPKQHEKIVKTLKTYSGNIDDFVCVIWDKNNCYYKGAEDGYYLASRFDIYHDQSYKGNFYSDDEITQQFKIEEPKNNDGREMCFWCKVKTERKMGFMSYYDICPKCKR